MSWMYRLIQRNQDETSLTLDSSVKSILWGDSTTPNTLSTATASVDAKGVPLYFSATSTAGTTYGTYVYLKSAGAGAEAIASRSKTVLTVAAGNAHGSHDTLEVKAAGYVTGLGTAIRGNIVFGADEVVPQGTYYAVMGEIYAAGNTSDLPTSNACLCCSVPTGTAMLGKANAIAFNATSGTGNMLYDKGSSITGTMTGWIRILVNGAVRYLPFYAAAPS